MGMTHTHTTHNHSMKEWRNFTIHGNECRLELETNTEVTPGDLNNGISFPLKEKKKKILGPSGLSNLRYNFWLELKTNLTYNLWLIGDTWDPSVLQTALTPAKFVGREGRQGRGWCLRILLRKQLPKQFWLEFGTKETNIWVTNCNLKGVNPYSTNPAGHCTVVQTEVVRGYLAFFVT